MNIEDYRRAMDRISPDDKLKERIMNQNLKKSRLPARRVFTGLLAAALAAACLFTAAFAASPELRTAVLSFFRMEEREQVPSGSGTPDGPDISKAEIGELVKAQYIRLDDRRYLFTGGLLTDLTWSDDWKTLQDAKFWEPVDGELLPVPVDMQTSQVDVTYQGIHYQGEFYWFIREGRLYNFTGENRTYDETLDDETNWYLLPIPDRTDALLLILSSGRQMEYSEYHMLYHLDTGEVEDILAGTGVAELDHAYGYDWSEDLRRAIILTGRQISDQQTWFCDLETKTLTPVDELADMDVYTAAFGDNDTLILYNTSLDEEDLLQDVAFYAYDIPTGQMKKTLDRTPYYEDQDDEPSGVMTFGSRCVLISLEGQVRAIDLKTGAQTILEGFTFQKGDRLVFNSAGNKLLYFSMNPDVESLGISQIGVADLEKGAFFAFERDGYENLSEGSIGWEDNNTVGIDARTLDGETRYLLLYQF